MLRIDGGCRAWAWKPLGAVVAVVAALLCVGAAASGAGSPDGTIDLQPLAVHRERLAAGQHHEYRVSLAAGQAAELVLRQLGAAGVKLEWTDQTHSLQPPLEPLHAGGATVRLTLIAEGDSSWQLHVSSAPSSTAAEYSIALDRPHTVTAADRQRATAEQHLARAEVLRRAKDRSRMPQALALYKQALAAFRAARDGCGTRAVYLARAALQDVWSDSAGSLGSAEQALQQACAGDTTGLGLGFAAVGSAKANLGDYVGAVEALERSATLLRQAGDSGILSGVLGNLAQDYLVLGQTQKSLDAAQAQLELAQRSGNRWYVAYARRMIGDARATRGELAPALDDYRQALDDLRAAPDPWLEAELENSLGSVYRRLGDGDRARESYAKAQALFASMKRWRGLADTAVNQGDSLLDDGKPRQAEAVYQRALELGKTHHLDDVVGEALRGLARSAMAQRDRSGARKLLNAALKQFRKTRAARLGARTYAALGDLEREQGDGAAARRRYEQALALARKSQDSTLQASALASLARVAADGGELLEARQRVERALELVESERAQLGDPRLRSHFLSSKRAYYALDVEILMQLDRQHPGQGYAEAALAAAELARARSLQDLLIERGVAIGKEVDPALLAREHDAEDRVRAAAYQLARLPADATPERRARLQAALDEAHARLDAARGRIRQANPRYAELAHPLRLTRGEIQTRLLDPDTVLLEYWLGEERSYLWVVAADGLQAYELAPRAHIEALAASLRDRVLARPASNVPIEQRPRIEASQHEAVQALARQLGQMLLAPAADALRRDRLVIVADGALQLVPFGLLAVDADALAAGHELTYLPSVATLRWLRRSPAAASAGRRVAVLADPVFRADDPRLVGGAALAASTPVWRDAGDLGLTELPRLPHSRREAEAIARLAPGSWVALDFAASRQAALAAHWQDYGIVHFATHALLDLRHPDLSGVVLSLYDADGRPRDGYLRMHDIYPLELPAELVVLSACESALGRDIAGEGLYSLARAFFYAGTPRVLASLWPVDDRASARFMALFYDALLARNLPPAAALSQAQLEMARDPQYAAPYYWAGYVLQGDWR